MISRTLRWLIPAVCVTCVSYAGDGIEFFESRIRPVLVEHCYECHSTAAAKIQGRLTLDFRDGLQNGGDSGPVIVPGKPEESLLYQALRHESLEMPPKERLSDAIIADFARWIREGAPDPRDRPPSAAEAAAEAWKVKLAQRRTWWSLQPLKLTAPPVVAEPGSVTVDRFLRSSLETLALSPSSAAAPEVLARRLSFVLTGLPPDSAEVQRFVARWQLGPDAAWQSLVDSMLASPHFGERFARHWMDVVRYTDTYGYEWDNPAKGSWEYRDYLTRAFNEDIGFDVLIREQLAGDLLQVPRINHEQQIVESLIGPMFFHLGEHRHGTSLDFNGIHQEMINNKIDAFSKAFLASTVACARCHDHKLDAVSQADYYALAGVFMSPRWTTRVIDVPDKHREPIEELKKRREGIRAKLADIWQSHRQQLDASHLRAWSGDQKKNWAKLAIDDLSYPLARILDAADNQVENLWSELAKEWRTAHDSRVASNATHYNVLCDFRERGLPPGWVLEGAGLEHGYVTSGEILVALDGESLVQRLLPRGYHTHALSSKLPGVIRMPPQHHVPGKFVSLQLCGGEWSSHLIVPQNAFQSEFVTFLDPKATPRWATITDHERKNGVTRVLVEISTASLNPNFPPRTGLARAGAVTLPPRDEGFDKRSWFSISQVVTHDTRVAPANTLDVFADLYAGEAPKSLDDAWDRIAAWVRLPIERWASGQATETDVEILNWLLTNQLLPNTTQVSPEIADLVKHYRDVEQQIDFPRTVNSMDERSIEPVDYRLNVRGNVDEEGDAVSRGFLEVFSSHYAIGTSQSSGRMELANFLTNPKHPQAARVYVNRVWQWIFGTGIVATSSDFGKLGDRPSHPELLDWLTAEFIQSGWSTKQLVRQLVLSEAFCQAGDASDIALQKDPENRLLHHFATRRLEAEAIRDNLLTVSGCLDPRLYGRPIYPPRVAEDEQKRLFAGPLHGHGRRSLYLQMSIMEPPKFLVTFNLPDLKLPNGRRDVTNVPAQALTLLNDPFVTYAAAQWAEHLIHDGSVSIQERIERMFLAAYARQPTQAECQRWEAAVHSIANSSDVMNDGEAWKFLAHAIFNSKEFIHFR